MGIVKKTNGELIVPAPRTFTLGGYRGYADGERVVRPTDKDYPALLALYKEQEDE